MSTKTDELMRLHEAAAEAYAWQAAGHDMGEAVRLKKDALRSAIQEAVMDAERYRWLCVDPNASFFDFEGKCCRNEPKADIDESIDAAMRQEPPEAQ